MRSRPSDIVSVTPDLFQALAVAAGFALVGVVAYSYVRPRPSQRPSITALIGVLGFALVSSPNWTSISFKGEGLELSLIREMQGRQLEALAALESCEDAQAADGESETSPHSVRVPATTPPRPVDPVEPAMGGEKPEPLPDPEKELLAQFERGELQLRELSNRELLTLNALVTRRTTGSLTDGD
jgi:hypothetical protein